MVCEGKKSSSRDEFGVQWSVKPYPQKAIAARLDADQPHQGVARQWFAGGDIVALLPLGGSEGNSVALVWSVSVERAEALEQMPPEEFCAALQARLRPGSGQLAADQRAVQLAAGAVQGRPLGRQGLGAGRRRGAHGASAGRARA